MSGPLDHGHLIRPEGATHLGRGWAPVTGSHWSALLARHELYPGFCGHTGWRRTAPNRTARNSRRVHRPDAVASAQGRSRSRSLPRSSGSPHRPSPRCGAPKAIGACARAKPWLLRLMACGLCVIRCLGSAGPERPPMDPRDLWSRVRTAVVSPESAMPLVTVGRAARSLKLETVQSARNPDHLFPSERNPGFASAPTSTPESVAGKAVQSVVKRKTGTSTRRDLPLMPCKTVARHQAAWSLSGFT